MLAARDTVTEIETVETRLILIGIMEHSQDNHSDSSVSSSSEFLMATLIKIHASKFMVLSGSEVELAIRPTQY